MDCRTSILRGAAAFSLMLAAASTAADSKSADEIRHAMQLKVASAYGECAAFYETAVAHPDPADPLDAGDAAEMRAEALTRAAAHAADVEDDATVGGIVDADRARARREHNHLAKHDPDAFSEAMADLRKRCRMAINDPTVFVERTLRDQHKKKQYFKLPPNLTAEMILKGGRPASGKKMDISKCTKPAVAHTLGLNDALVESGMICVQHSDGVCDSERSWVSYRQYIEQRYPDRELDGYSERVTYTFKGGKTQQVRKLIACVVAPEYRS